MRVITTMLGLGWLATAGSALAQSNVTANVITVGGGPIAPCGTTAGYVNGSTTQSSQFNAPYGIAADSRGNVYIADKKNNAVRLVTSPNVPSTSSTFTYGARTFPSVIGVATDPLDNVYILEANGGIVFEYNRFANSISTNTPLNFPDTATAIAAAQDGSGRIFVASDNSGGAGSVWVYDMANGLSQQILTANNFQPAGLAFSSGEQLVVSDLASNAIYLLNTNSAQLTLFAGGNGAGYVDGIPSLSRFNQPHGVCSSSDGHIVVADTANNFVREIDPEGNTTTLYGTTSNFWPAATYCDSSPAIYRGWFDGPAGGDYFTYSSAEAFEPCGVTLSSNGVLFVTELYYNLLREVTGTGLSVVTTNSIVTNATGLPPAPAFFPNAGYFPFPQIITITSTVPNVFYTLDGTIPNSNSFVLPETFVSTNPVLNQGYYVASLTWSNSNADLSALRFIALNGTGSSPVSSGVGISIPAPIFGPNSGYYFSNQTITVTSLVPKIYFTVDGTTPTTNATLLTLANYVRTNASPDQGYFYGSFVWSNSLDDLSNLKIISALTTGVSPVASGIPFVVPPPTFSPISGYYPDCVQITVNSAVPVLYYTLDGSAPTTNSTSVTLTNFIQTNASPSQGYFTGTFQVCDTGSDLTSFRIVSALGVSLSSSVGGQPTSQDLIGFARDTYAGPGSTAVIPVVVTLRANTTLQSIQFLVEIDPGPTNTYSSLAPFTLLPIGSNDFLPLTGPGTGNAAVNFDPFDYVPTPGGRGMALSSIGDSNHFSIQGSAVIVLLAVPIPVVPEGTTYSLNVFYPSGTSDGLQGPIPLTNMPPRNLIVSSVRYLSGDSSPATGYNAGEFGDRQLENADVNNAFYASVNIRVPFTFSDAYNAMDAYPEAPGIPGDGLITYLDWQTILNRSLGRDTNNWERYWASDGTLTNSRVSWTPNSGPAKLDVTKSAPGSVWLRQAVVSAQSVETPFGTCRMPVYVNVQSGDSLAGLQFRAIISANGNAPAPANLQFIPNSAPGFPNPLTLPGLSDDDIICGWSLGAFSPALVKSNFLGYLSFTIPPSATPGESYSVHFIGVDGAPNISTFYQMESFPATAMLFGPPPAPASFTSDEWKTYFFGSLSNPLAADNVDADGDGMSNLQEYLAGTNPTNSLSALQFSTSSLTVGGTPAANFGWLTAPGKTYVLESRGTLGGSSWTAVSTNVGDGYVYQATLTNYSGNTRFYRLRLQQ